MTEVDEKLRDQPFKVDAFACKAAADVLATYQARGEDLPWAAFPRDAQFSFKLAFVSVCHQINWDFLQRSLAKRLLADAGDLADRLANTRSKDVAEWLDGYDRPERILPEERAALLRDLGRRLRDHYSGQGAALLQAAAGRIGGPGGLLDRLDLFDAFRADPLRKKSNILVQELVRENIARFRDEDSIDPGVDYHLIRVYLRTGRVRPTSDAVAAYLEGRSDPRRRLVTLLRAAVSDAVRLTARYAKVSVPVVNYLEWQIGRAICDRDSPACRYGPTGREVPTDIRVMYESGCPYAEFCAAYRDDNWLRLQEPEFKSIFY